MPATPARRKPFKGESEPRDQPIRWRQVTYSPADGNRSSPYQTVRWLIDSHYFDDLLASCAETRVDEMDLETGEITGQIDQWQLNAVDDPEYSRQLAGMHKVIVRSRKGDVERWRPKSEGARIDWRMCKVYQAALATARRCASPCRHWSSCSSSGRPCRRRRIQRSRA